MVSVEMVLMRCHNVFLYWIQGSLRQLHKTDDPLTLKASITTAADDSLKYIFTVFVIKKCLIFHEISSRIFFERLKVKIIKVSSAAISLGPLKVNAGSLAYILSQGFLKSWLPKTSDPLIEITT